MNYEKTGRYVITPLLSCIFAKTEWKNLFYNWCYRVFSFWLKIAHIGHIWAYLMTSMGDVIQKKNYVSMFLIWCTFIVVSFIILAIPSQILWRGGSEPLKSPSYRGLSENWLGKPNEDIPLDEIDVTCYTWCRFHPVECFLLVSHSKFTKWKIFVFIFCNFHSHWEFYNNELNYRLIWDSYVYCFDVHIVYHGSIPWDTTMVDYVNIDAIGVKYKIQTYFIIHILATRPRWMFIDNNNNKKTQKTTQQILIKFYIFFFSFLKLNK